MAQSTEPSDRSLKEVVVITDDDARNESQQPQRQIKDPTFEDSLKGGSIPLFQGDSTSASGLARRRNKELTDATRGRGSRAAAEGVEEVTECSSRATSRMMFMSRSRTRLEEDPIWSRTKAASSKKDEDSFLDEDFLEEFFGKKLSPFTVVQWVALVLIMATLSCTLSISQLKQRTLWDLPLWKWEILIMVIICGNLVSGWGIRVIVFFIERSFLLKIRVLYFVYGMRKAVQHCIWLALVLVPWHFLVAENFARETKNKVLPCITKILVCLLVGAFIWLVKVLIVKVLASSFHVSKFFDQIKLSLFKQYVIKKLSEPPADEAEREQEDRMTERKNNLYPNLSKRLYENKTIERLQNLNKKNVSALRMKRLISLVQGGVLSPRLSTLDEDLSDSSEEESSLTIRAECEAKALAKKIFPNVDKEGTGFICLEDLRRYMPEDKALKAMELFEGERGRTKINRQSFTNWMADAFKERRFVALSIHDTRTAVDDLHSLLDVVVAIIIVIIWLLILGIPITHFMVLLSSQLLLAAFVFGNSLKTTFEAIIFLFIMHPFDVGDRCEVDGEQMVVEEMNILTTVFLRHDFQKVIYPNSVLATKPIGNYYRSPDMGDAVEFSVHISTPWEKIEKLKGKIISYINSRPDHWYRDPAVIVKDVEDMNRLQMAVWLRHRMNHDNMSKRWSRRGLLIEEMIKVFRELDIEYRMLPLDINVRNTPASNGLPSNWKTCAP